MAFVLSIFQNSEALLAFHFFGNYYIYLLKLCIKGTKGIQQHFSCVVCLSCPAIGALDEGLSFLCSSLDVCMRSSFKTKCQYIGILCARVQWGYYAFFIDFFFSLKAFGEERTQF